MGSDISRTDTLNPAGYRDPPLIFPDWCKVEKRVNSFCKPYALDTCPINSSISRVGIAEGEGDDE